MKINEEGTTALKKDVLADINQHGQYAILSSTGDQDLAILLSPQPSEEEIKNNVTPRPEFYQLETIAGKPLKKDRDEKIAVKFYEQQLGSVASMLQQAGVKTLILDYNLSFWVYKKKENMATYLVNNSGAETVWANVKTRLATEETLVELLPKDINYHETPLTKSGIIALSLLRSYAPERLAQVAFFSANLTQNVKTTFELAKKKQKEEKPNQRIPLPKLIEPELVFDIEQEKEDASELEALEWALQYAHKIRNPRYEKTFKKLVERAKKPVIKEEAEHNKKIVRPLK